MGRTSRIYLALVHYPVLNKNNERITTSITNLDIHDIARCVATFAVEKYYLIHPLESQERLVQEVIDYWQKGYGAVYNPDRKEALRRVAVKKSLAAVKEEIAKEDGRAPQIIVTDAQVFPSSVSYTYMRQILEEKREESYLLLFGTGWGMAQEIVDEADYILAPVYGANSTYNHLSVRSAAAIILDRLLGEKWW
jgi:hypothetical protein